MAIKITDDIKILQRKDVVGGEVDRKLKMSASRTDDVAGSTISKKVIKWVTGNDVPVIEAMAVELGDMILAEIPGVSAEATVIGAYKTSLHTYLTERSDLQ